MRVSVEKYLRGTRKMQPNNHYSNSPASRSTISAMEKTSSPFLTQRPIGVSPSPGKHFLMQLLKMSIRAGSLYLAQLVLCDFLFLLGGLQNLFLLPGNAEKRILELHAWYPLHLSRPEGHVPLGQFCMHLLVKGMRQYPPPHFFFQFFLKDLSLTV